MRFAYGADYTARRLSRHLAGVSVRKGNRQDERFTALSSERVASVIRPGRPAVVDPVSPDRVDLAADAMEASGPIEGRALSPRQAAARLVRRHRQQCRLRTGRRRHGATWGAVCSYQPARLLCRVGERIDAPHPASLFQQRLADLFVRSPPARTGRERLVAPSLIVPLDEHRSLAAPQPCRNSSAFGRRTRDPGSVARCPARLSDGDQPPSAHGARCAPRSAQAAPRGRDRSICGRRSV